MKHTVRDDCALWAKTAKENPTVWRLYRLVLRHRVLRGDAALTWRR